MEIKFNSDASYRSLCVSLSHVPDHDFVFGMANRADAYYVHACQTSGVIVRFGALGSDWEEIEAALINDGFDGDACGDLLVLMGLAYADGYQALHFDVDAERVEGATWYTESGNTIRPVAHDLPLLYWHDLDDAQKAVAMSDCGVDKNSADDYFIENNSQFIYLPASESNDATLFYLSDCLRIDNDDELHGAFDGYFSENAFSRLLVKLQGDWDSVNLSRECA